MDTPTPGSRYRHYKGNEYEVLCLAKLEADLTDVVVYRGVADPEKVWVRPLAMFLEDVDVHGVRQPRFARI